MNAIKAIIVTNDSAIETIHPATIVGYDELAPQLLTESNLVLADRRRTEDIMAYLELDSTLAGLGFRDDGYSTVSGFEAYVR